MSKHFIPLSESQSSRGEDSAAGDVHTVAKGGAVQVAGQITSRLLNFLFVLVSLRWLGVGPFGLYRQVLQVLNVSGIIAPGGFHHAAVRYLARARATGDHGAVRGSARVALGGALVVSLLLCAAVFAAAEQIAQAFADTAAKNEQMTFLIRVGVPFIPLYAAMQVLSFCTQAYKTMVPSVVVTNIIQPSTRFVLGVLALLAGFSLTGVVTSLVLSMGVGALAAAYYYVRMLTPEERGATPRSDTADIVKFALPQSGVNLFGINTLGLGIFILGILSTDQAVGLFTIALSLQLPGTVFLRGIHQIWSPMVADLYERGEIVRLESLYQTVNRWIATFSLPVFAALMLEPDLFVSLFAGPQGAAAADLVVILAIGNIFATGTGPCSYLLSMTGRPGLNLVNSVVGVVLYAGLGWILVPRYGVVAMAAVDAGVTALVNIARVIEAKILIGVQPYGRTFAKPVLATLAGAAVLLAWRPLPGTGSIVDLAGVAVAGVVYIATLRALGLDPEERAVIDRLRARVFKNRKRTKA
jgi:O-antigen/teichoic acid export membrane protein